MSRPIKYAFGFAILAMLFILAPPRSPGIPRSRGERIPFALVASGFIGGAAWLALRRRIDRTRNSFGISHVAAIVFILLIAEGLLLVWFEIDSVELTLVMFISAIGAAVALLALALLSRIAD